MQQAWATGLLALALLTACEQELILPGERLDLRADLSEEAPTTRSAESPNESRPISLPSARSDAGWTQRGSGPANDTGHRALPETPRLAWSGSVGQGNSRKHRITAQPVVADGRIYTVDSRSTVTAHSLNGEILWQVDVTPRGEHPDDASGAGLAYADGRLFVTSGFGFLAALDAATGEERWRQRFDIAVAGAPAVANGTVYAVTRDERAWAIDANDGRELWYLEGTPSPAGVLGGAAPAIADGRVILPFASTEIVAATPGGERQWAAVVAGQRPGRVYAQITDVTGDPVVSGGRVFAGNPSGRMVALDAGSGSQLWFAEDGAMSAVSVVGGSVFAVNDKAELVRLDADTGERIWGVELPFFQREDNVRRRKEVHAHFGPVLAGGQLWVASSDGVLRAFDPEDGTTLREIELPGGAATSPVVAGGTLYVVNTRGQLLAFR